MRCIVDTSIWVSHFRQPRLELIDLLNEDAVLVHPDVFGELACGNLKNRGELLRHLQTLPAPLAANHNEVMELIERRKLWGFGIGWVDVRLLAAALISNCRLWTDDKALARLAAGLGVAHRER